MLKRFRRRKKRVKPNPLARTTKPLLSDGAQEHARKVLEQRIKDHNGNDSFVEGAIEVNFKVGSDGVTPTMKVAYLCYYLEQQDSLEAFEQTVANLKDMGFNQKHARDARSYIETYCRERGLPFKPALQLASTPEGAA